MTSDNHASRHLQCLSSFVIGNLEIPIPRTSAKNRAIPAWHCLLKSKLVKLESNTLDDDSELASYKVEETMPLNSNPLLWWKANELKYPIFSKLGERPFSSTGYIVSAQMSCLHSEHLDKLLFLRKI